MLHAIFYSGSAVSMVSATAGLLLKLPRLWLLLVLSILSWGLLIVVGAVLLHVGLLLARGS
jgi:hypothetical protein